MSSEYRANFYIFTGGPGMGKTSVIHSLAEKGFACIPEVARNILREQRFSQGNAVHTGDRPAYYRLMLNRSISDFMHTPEKPIHFFDRGLPDLYSYQSQYFDEIDTSLIQHIARYRYNNLAFIFPPWREIYCHDEERKLPFEEAVVTYHSVRRSYERSGYRLLEVPRMSVDERCHFILWHISH